MAKRKQSVEELEGHLADSIVFTRTSARLFDEGQEREAQRLAVEIRKMVHHTRKSKALLKQLGLRRQIQFCDTANPNPAGTAGHSGLAGVWVTPERNFFAPLLDYGLVRQRLAFADWWRQPILSDGGRNQFSREYVALKVANTDGGAHVDPELDEVYYRLTRENAFGLQAGLPGHPIRPTGTPHLAIVRQIAYELLLSLSECQAALPAKARTALL